MGRFALRWARRGAIVLLVLVALLVGLYLTRGSTLHPLLVRTLPSITRALTPFEIRVAEIEGDWTSTLTVRGVDLVATDPDQVLRSVRADEVALEGRFLGFARSLDLADLQRAVATAPAVEIDTRDLAPRDDAPRGDGLPIAMTSFPELRIEGGSFTWIDEMDIVEVTELDARSPYGDEIDVEVSGRAVATAWSASIRGATRIGRDGSISFSADVDEGRVQDLDLRLEDVVGAVSSDGVEIESAALRVGSNEFVVSALTVVPVEDALPAIGGALTFEIPRIDDLPGVVDAALGREAGSLEVGRLGWFGSARGSVTLEPFPGRIATGTIDLSGEDIALAGVRIGSVQSTLVADDDRIVVRELRANDPGRAFIDAVGTYEFDSATLSGVSASIQLADPDVYAEELSFLHDLDARVSLEGPLSEPTGTVNLRASRLEIGERAIGRVETDATLEDWTLDVTRLVAATDDGRIDAAARVGLPVGGAPLTVSLESLGIERLGARLDLAEPVAISVDGSRVLVDDLRLAGTAGELEVDVDTRSDVGQRVAIETRALRFAPFLTDLLEEGDALGELDGTARYQSDPLVAAVDLRVADARLAEVDVPIGAHAVAEWKDDRLEVTELTANLLYGDISLAGSVPLRATAAPLQDGPVRIEGTARVNGRSLREGLLTLVAGFDPSGTLADLSGEATLSLDVDGTWRALEGAVGLELVDLQPIEGSQSALTVLPGDIDGTLRLELGDEITLAPSELTVGGDVAQIVADGRIARGLDLVALLDDPAPLLDADVMGKARVTAANLGWLSDLQRELREISGGLTADLRVGGTLRNLRPEGEVELVDCSVRYRGAPPVKDLDLRVDASPEEIRIQRTRFLLGASPVDVEGRLALAEEEPRVELGIAGDDILLFRSPDARVRANVDLSLAGTASSMLLSGDVALVGGRLRSPVEFQRLLEGGNSGPASVRRGISLPELGPKALRFDVGVTTADPMLLSGRLTRGEIRADVRLVGDGSYPILSGRVFVDPLTVALPAGNVEFQTGLVDFDADNPEIPTLEFVGTTRLAGYDVIINVKGDIDDPEIDMVSTPPLNPNDLVLLVLTGQPPSAGVGAAAAGEQVFLYVAKDLVRGWFDSGDFDEDTRRSFIDRIEVVTGRDISRGGVLTVRGSLLLKEGLARERDAVYAVVERDAFEDYNLGVRLVLRLR
ncbi:MAG: translocation/assembly module TamB domain-containing protein [Planctomycetota bacterium]